MKKHVHELLTDCLNLSCISTLSPQVSNENVSPFQVHMVGINFNKN